MSGVTSVRFWRQVWPLVREVVKSGYPVNRVINEAVLAWLGGVDVSTSVQLKARLFALMKEEKDLREQSRVMLRSGSFLPKYADRILRPLGSGPSFVRRGEQPLRALSPNEEQIFRRILARREKIASEIVEIQDKLLPREKFRLKPRRCKRRSHSRETHRRVDANTKKEE